MRGAIVRRCFRVVVEIWISSRHARQARLLGESTHPQHDHASSVFSPWSRSAPDALAFLCLPSTFTLVIGPVLREYAASKSSNALCMQLARLVPNMASRPSNFSDDVVPWHQASVRRSRRSIAIRKAARPGAGVARLRNGLQARRIAIGF